MKLYESQKSVREFRAKPCVKIRVNTLNREAMHQIFIISKTVLWLASIVAKV